MQQTELTIVARLRDRLMRSRLGQLGRAFGRFGRVAARPFQFVSRNVKGLSSRIFRLRTAIIALVGATVFGALTRSIAEQGRELDIWSQKLGTSVQSLSTLSAAAQSQGFDFDTLREGLKTLQERMDDASQGAETYARQFRKLGVEVVDSQGRLRNVVDILPEISAGFQRVAREGGPQELVLITEDLIGGSENLLSVWLQQGPQAFQASIDRARQLGFVIGDDFVKASNRFLTAWTEVSLRVKGLLRGVFVALEPVFTAIIQEISGFLADLKNSVGQGGGFAAVFDRIASNVLSFLLRIAAGLLNAVGSVLGFFETIRKALRSFFTDLEVGFIKAKRLVRNFVADSLQALVDGVQALAENGFFGLLGGLLGDFLEESQGPIESALNSLRITEASTERSIKRVRAEAEELNKEVDFGASALKAYGRGASLVADGIDRVGLAALQNVPLVGGFVSGVLRLRDATTQAAQKAREFFGNAARAGTIAAGGPGGGIGGRAAGFAFSAQTPERSNQRAQEERRRLQAFEALAERVQVRFRAMQEEVTRFSRTAVGAFTRIGRAIEDGLTDAFVNVINGTQSLSEAFSRLGELILLELQRIIVRLIVVQTLAAALSALTGVPAAALAGGLGAGNSRVGDPAGDIGSARSARSVALASSGIRGGGINVGGVQVTLNAPVQAATSGDEVIGALASQTDALGALVARSIVDNSAARAAAAGARV
ncbi:MAG: hypothetical protein AAF196_02935 [Planctomycetota bacterium]